MEISNLISRSQLKHSSKQADEPERNKVAGRGFLKYSPSIGDAPAAEHLSVFGWERIKEEREKVDFFFFFFPRTSSPDSY